MRGVLWFYWRIIVEACKILVYRIWHGEIKSFIIIIPFQLNYIENFTIPTNIDIVVFF